MTPEQLAKSGTEHAEQRALFAWANMACRHGFGVANNMEYYVNKKPWSFAGPLLCVVPELKWLHAIPNAGARGNKIAAAQLVAEGVKAGVADILLPVKTYSFSGLYIEMKRKNGKPSDVTAEQREFMLFVESQGYVWTVAFGWRMAADTIQRYMGYVS